MTHILSNDTHSGPWSVRLAMSTDWRDIDLAVITVTGEIDAANTREMLDYTLGKVLLCRRMELDLTGVGFFASDGYWMLKTLESRCALADIEFSLRPGTRVSRALQICEHAEQQ
jgi:anti-anti-sigma regulatory factor